MAKKEEKSSSSCIPREIIEIILSKLPAKSLLRFRSVSKSWNTMISDHVFVKEHLRNSPNNLLVRRHRYSTEGGFSFVKLEGRKFHAQAVLDSPNSYDNILCECNGVLLLTMCYPSRYTNYLLWNPSIRRERYLVCPYDDDEGYPQHAGICYDPVTDDFKVVLIAKTTYAIYSCKKDSWTRKEGFRNDVLGARGVFFDGAIYWVLSVNAMTMLLVYFDPKTDELKRLHNYPEGLSEDDFFYFFCSRGSLCLYTVIRDDDVTTTNFQIWIKEKGIVGENPNWKEFVTFKNVPTTINYLRPICLVENKILVQLDLSRYAYYIPSEKRFDEFEEKRGMFVPYRNSLYGAKTIGY